MSTNLLEPPTRKPPSQAPPRIPPPPTKTDSGDGWGKGGPFRNFRLRLLFTYFFLFLMFVFWMTAQTAYNHHHMVWTYIFGTLGVGSYIGYIISYAMLLMCMGDELL